MKVKLLIVDDQIEHYLAIKEFLHQITTIKINVHWCDNYQDAFKKIEEDNYDIYMIDHDLEGQKGLTLIENARKAKNKKPLILLAEEENVIMDTEAMNKGASDYIVKSGVSVENFERTIRYTRERYLHQIDLYKKEKKYRNLFELSTNPLLILTSGYQIVEFNSAFKNSFGEDAVVLNSASFQNFFVKQDDFFELKAKLELKRAVKSFRTELRIREDILPVILTLSIIVDADNTENIHVSINDITKILKVESQLKQKEKSSMTSRMARMIAHEVRNPLTNINLAVGEMEEEVEKDAEIRLYINMIKRNSGRINTLIEELLKSTKINTLDLKPQKMTAIVKAALDFSKDRIDLMEVDVETNFENVEVRNYDTNKLTMAFTNIIANAIEAMENTEKPKLKISVGMQLEKVCVVISDNGKGIDKEGIENIFEPFYTKRRDGLGLGMTATANVIRLHDGEITLHSELGIGTQFIILV